MGKWGDDERQMSQVTSRIRLAAAFSSALAEAPASRSCGSSRSSPPRSCPRDLRRSSDPTLVALWRATRHRFARRLRQPPAALAPLGIPRAPLRLRAPVRASRAVKPRSPAPFALRGQTRRALVARAACVNRPPPAQRLSRLSVRYSPTGRAAFAEAPAPLPAAWTGVFASAASQAASGEPPATRSAEPSSSTTWDNFNTIPRPERCQAFFQANFGN